MLQDSYASKMASISAFLQVEREQDIILAAIQQKQQPGSCQWLSRNETFQDWLGSGESMNSDLRAREKAVANSHGLTVRRAQGSR